MRDEKNTRPNNTVRFDRSVIIIGTGGSEFTNEVKHYDKLLSLWGRGEVRTGFVARRKVRDG